MIFQFVPEEVPRSSRRRQDQADRKNLTRPDPVTLRDKTALGMSLPHRSPDPLALTTIGTVARRAEELGFRDLWVTENTVDEGTCLDPVVALTFRGVDYQTDRRRRCS